MYLLRPALQRYEWGSLDDIPAFLGLEADGAPYAEAWWGAHPAAPSTIEVDGAWWPLDEFIENDPEATLGAEVAAHYRNRLPFLLKVLAIAKPLSIQVHPSVDVAEDGFAREEQSGLPRDAPNRVYRDPHHKPEMIVALEPMVVLSGFRRASHVAADLAAVGGDTALRLADLLATGSSGPVGLAAYLRTVLTDPSVRDVIPDIALTGTGAGASSNLAVAAAAAEQFPGDPGVLVALALNVVHLQPGEACFTPDGILHSYQSGFGIEIMANSDNVIRAGLTPKHVDVPALLDVARTAPESPHRPREVEEGSTVTYVAAAREFRLVIVQGGAATFPSGPRIVLALDGATSAHAGDAGKILERGGAVFVADADGPLEVETSGQAAVAFVPPNGT